MIVTTTHCSEYGHQEFEINVDPEIVELDVLWFLGYLENGVSKGQVYTSDETIQVGWMINRVCVRNNNTLGLCEPDMQTVPVTWLDSVSTTLRHLRLQKDVTESLGLSERIAFPTIQQSAIVGKFYDTANLLQMDRDEADGNDSGWFIGSADHGIDYNNVENLERVSLYEVACKRPEIIMFLSLPTGINITLSKVSAEVILQGRILTWRAGSFLDRYFTSQ